MREKLEDTARRISQRKYEERKKEERKKSCSNFQTMIPRELYVEIDTYLHDNNLTKVQFIKDAFEKLKNKADR